MTERSIEKWRRLRGVREGDGVLEVPSLPSGIETGFGPIRFAIGRNGQPRLLVPCGPGAFLGNGGARDNISVTLTRYEVSGRSTIFVDIMCTNRALDTVFAELVDEIVDRIAGGQAPTNAVEGTMDDFRSLLRDSADREVSDQSILGLVGELLVLRSLVRISAQAVDTWMGPYGQRHDFRHQNDAIEVKTSARADAASVTISSQEQLAVSEGGSLVLVHIRVERSDAGELSVSSLASDIQGCGVPRKRLDKGLEAAGCQDSDAPEWNRLAFSLEGIAGYQVLAGFPRITSKQFQGDVFPPGIVSLEYVVDLSTADRFRLSEIELGDAFARVAS